MSSYEYEIQVIREQRDVLLVALRDLCDAIPDSTIAADPPLGAWLNIARVVIEQVECRRVEHCDCEQEFQPDLKMHASDCHARKV
jgi:hypothetical protein